MAEPRIVIRIRRRWFPVRLRNAYRLYRAIGMTRWQSFRFAWEINWR